MSVNDEELRWRLEVLKAQFEAGKIFIASHLADDLQRSLSAIRYGPDGRIDLATVDGRIRSLTLVAAAMHEREEAKKAASLKEISNLYFDFIEQNLGFIIDEAKNKGYNAQQFAMAVSENTTAAEELASGTPKLLESFQTLWDGIGDASHYHIQDLTASKAIYGGDLFPSYKKNIASSLSLYIDTIVLSDPFWNSRHIFEMGSPKQKAFYLIKHAINVSKYSALAREDLAKPIVVFSPFRSSVDENEAKMLKAIADADALKHAGALYGRDFESADELLEFSDPLDTADKVIGALKDPSRLLIDTEWKGSLREQIERHLAGEWVAFAGESHAGRMVAGQCFGRMAQATDVLMKSRYLGGTPLIDAPTSWRYFNWKLEYNSAIEPGDLTHLHMVRGLQHVATSDEQWLGAIPPEALVEMRKVGAFEEIRGVLAEGIRELAEANPTGFFRTSDMIVENIQGAFERHSKEVRALRNRKIKFAGHDLGSMIVAAGLEVASIAVGTPTFGAASFAFTQLVDAPKLRQIPERFRTLRNAHNELRKSPMGLFFRHKR
ncbi:hypothetical protein ACFW16_32695 [Inquilinus sp. NPDC058860]|uniref:hypothetical protein n=1 Tax=Inquilinus sp. NPDC058860 TaxID=3346652 RepID=UPI0036A44FF7